VEVLDAWGWDYSQCPPSLPRFWLRGEMGPGKPQRVPVPSFRDPSACAAP